MRSVGDSSADFPRDERQTRNWPSGDQSGVELKVSYFLNAFFAAPLLYPLLDREELYKVPAEGGKAEKLNIQGRGPDLSPDGKKIAYYRKAEQRMDFWLVENFLPIDK